MKYAVIDLETTGGSVAQGGRIIEIAIIILEDGVEINRFESFVNPEMSIPPFISKLTGIKNNMVKDAPKFFEIAKQVVEVTKDCLFVAHNADFDYNFVKDEFKELGYKYRRNSICTVELSRVLLPGKQSYSLGKLCDEIGIPHNKRHRAIGDTEATAKLFQLLLEQENALQTIEEMTVYDVYSSKRHYQLSKDIIDNLPDETGVYYLYNKEEELIYVGKSKNIRKRILQHLSNKTTPRAVRMADMVRNVKTTLTGSELVALLLESDEIKKYQPRFNRAQRRTKQYFGIYKLFDEKGYINFKIAPLSEGDYPVTTTFSRKEADRILDRMIDKNELCPKLCGVDHSKAACFRYHLKTCKGACCDEEAVESYNKRAMVAAERFGYGVPNMFILDKGRDEQEKAIVQIEKGIYRGFGFVKNKKEYSPSELKKAIKSYKDNADVNKIIRGILRKKKGIERKIFY
ncbi:3'-5' exonuclease family protein [Flammeovirga agarivorans]|uniref:GIY-YIG nuclease family protein n=1 Tax=Flammeovirga agarivorans TaxID=2726742 RepID=A0A7X8SI30_9BACT|nr:exonuclease domain-containing protein [Flammeovirga agarivorans]NLR90606.1 GIY-YIG nuclease family protein [Flammeovirga agarivorans]